MLRLLLSTSVRGLQPRGALRLYSRERPTRAVGLIGPMPLAVAPTDKVEDSNLNLNHFQNQTYMPPIASGRPVAGVARVCYCICAPRRLS